MAIDLDRLLSLRTARRAFRWDATDAKLYALGVGFGHDPLDEGDLAFLAGAEPRVLPTMATVVAWGIGPDRAEMGIDYAKVVHAEQAIVMAQPLKAAQAITAEAHVASAFDRGPDKGAMIRIETRLFDEADGLIATVSNTILARGDGGFGGPPPPPSQSFRAERPADDSVTLTTRPEQALLYALNGDDNPLHADPERARSVGFPRPILHGLCTYGLACRAVLRATGRGPEDVLEHAVRFSSPVYPGETLQFDLWREDGAIRFEGRVVERGVVVISNGLLRFRA